MILSDSNELVCNGSFGKLFMAMVGMDWMECLLEVIIECELRTS